MPARALDTFSAVYFRGLAVLRALVVLFTVSYVGIWWRDWYGQRPGGLVGPALVVAWSLVYIAVTARRALPRALVLVDVAIGIAVGLTAPWTVPDASLGDPSSWVLLTVVFAALSAVCALRTRFSLVAILALACAHFIPAHDHRPQVVTSTGLLLFIGLALRQGVSGSAGWRWTPTPGWTRSARGRVPSWSPRRARGRRARASASCTTRC